MERIYIKDNTMTLPSSIYHNANEQMRDKLLQIADYLKTGGRP